MELLQTISQQATGAVNKLNQFAETTNQNIRSNLSNLFGIHPSNVDKHKALGLLFIEIIRILLILFFYSHRCRRFGKSNKEENSTTICSKCTRITKPLKDYSTYNSCISGYCPKFQTSSRKLKKVETTIYHCTKRSQR